MSNCTRKGFCFLFLIGSSVFGMENFSAMTIGNAPDRPQWGATAGKRWTVVDSGDDHGKILEISGSQKRFGRCNFPDSCPKSLSSVLIEFDFKTTGSGNQEVGVLDKSFKLADYFRSAAFRLKFDGKSGTLQYFAEEKWNPAGNYEKGNWNHLQIKLQLSGKDAGYAFLNLNGKDAGRFPLRLNGNKTRFERLWFTDETGGSDKLFIDNLKLEYHAGKGASRKTVLESPERVSSFSFYSNALKKDRHCYVVLPPKVAKNDPKKYPLLIVLHGRGRNASSLLQEPVSRRALLNFRGVVLLVQGDDGWYIDSPVKSKDRYGSMMTELIAAARKELPVSPAGESWGIVGWSMGAYGAAMTAEAHPEQFSAVALLIGVLDYPRKGLPEKQSYPVVTDRFGNDPAVWAQYNPITNVKNLSGKKLFIRTGVYSFDLIMNRNFREEVRKLNISCDYRELPGGHDFPLVCAAMYDVIDFMNRNLQHP